MLLFRFNFRGLLSFILGDMFPSLAVSCMINKDLYCTKIIQEKKKSFILISVHLNNKHNNKSHGKTKYITNVFGKLKIPCPEIFKLAKTS